MSLCDCRHTPFSLPSGESLSFRCPIFTDYKLHTRLWGGLSLSLSCVGGGEGEDIYLNRLWLHKRWQVGTGRHLGDKKSPRLKIPPFPSLILLWFLPCIVQRVWALAFVCYRCSRAVNESEANNNFILSFIFPNKISSFSFFLLFLVHFFLFTTKLPLLPYLPICLGMFWYLSHPTAIGGRGPRWRAPAVCVAITVSCLCLANNSRRYWWAAFFPSSSPSHGHGNT